MMHHEDPQNLLCILFGPQNSQKVITWDEYIYIYIFLSSVAFLTNLRIRDLNDATYFLDLSKGTCFPLTHTALGDEEVHWHLG
jgi:hypothetical protein